ncbi:MAG TPA: O-antigen ligase family protein [Gaiellaceae bacterium]|jgi:putative inorganic carbon (HCO3(-)) transporter|nr:O-antigen ligase family protein [Gaiellaceae bacterium]
MPAPLFARAGPGAGVGWAIAASFSALALAAATLWNVQAALGLVILAGVGIAVALSPTAILPILIATVFVEMVHVGGVRITRLVAPLAMLVVLAAASRKGTELRPASPLFWACGYALWALASGTWTVHVGGTVFLLSSLAICLVYMFAFAMMLGSRRDLDRILYAIAISSLLVSILSIFAFLGRPIGPFGATTLQEGRVQGATGDPSFFAALQLVALPLILVLANEVKALWLRLALYGTAVLGIASVFSTVSRGGFLQLLAIIALLLVFPSRRLFASPAQKALVMLVILAGAVTFFTRYQADLAPRLETILHQGQGGATETASGRLVIWPAARDAFDSRPFTGIGYGAFVETSVDRLYDTRNTFIGSFKVHPEQVHNTFLGQLAELGIPGLVLFLGLLASTIRMLRRTATKARRAGELFVNRVANALLLGIIAWCVGAFFISAETSRPIWIAIGICLALPKLIPAEAPAAGPET